MKHYDVIVIGSGAGGLTAALALARAGRRVVVFEQHYLPGGYTQSFAIQSFRFSPGVHYVGGLGVDGELRRIYEGLGVSESLEFFELNPDGYDHVQIGDQRFDIPAGRVPYERRLIERFPDEANGIRGYFEDLLALHREVTSGTDFHSLRDILRNPYHIASLLRGGFQTIDQFLDRYTQDPLLRAILTIQSGDHGMAPSRVPSALHAGLVSHYLDGAYYPRGGAHSIPAALIRQLRRQGGEIRVRTEVTEILVRGGRAHGVRLADGTTVEAEHVISNADPGVTWGRLVPAEETGFLMRRRVSRTEFSTSALILFFAVDTDLRAKGLDSGNRWFSRTADIDAMFELRDREQLEDLDELPGIFLAATSLKDPTLRHDGRHTLEAVAFCPVEAFDEWRDVPHDELPADYRRLKAKLTDLMFRTLDNVVPGLRGHVVFHELGTPLTNAHYIAATGGNIYGTEKSLRNLGPFSFPIRTEIDRLLQCGASTLAPGVLAVTRSGLMAAQAVLGCSRDELLTAAGPPLRVHPAEPNVRLMRLPREEHATAV